VKTIALMLAVVIAGVSATAVAKECPAPPPPVVCPAPPPQAARTYEAVRLEIDAAWAQARGIDTTPGADWFIIAFGRWLTEKHAAGWEYDDNTPTGWYIFHSVPLP
jgi:hypothetical protein